MPSKRWLIGSSLIHSDSELEKDLCPTQLKILKEFSLQFHQPRPVEYHPFVLFWMYLLVTNVVEKHDFSKKNAENQISAEQRSVLYFLKWILMTFKQSNSVCHICQLQLTSVVCCNLKMHTTKGRRAIFKLYSQFVDLHTLNW